MIQFPNTLPAPNFDAKLDFENNIIRSETENGKTLTRRRFTKARKKFELDYSFNNTQLKTFVDFWENEIKDGSLSFELSLDGKMYKVLFDEPPQINYTNYNQYKISCKLTEVI